MPDESVFHHLEHRIGATIVAMFYLLDREREQALDALLQILNDIRSMPRANEHDHIQAMAAYLVRVDDWCRRVHDMTYEDYDHRKE